MSKVNLFLVSETKVFVSLINRCCCFANLTETTFIIISLRIALIMPQCYGALIVAFLHFNIEPFYPILEFG